MQLYWNGLKPHSYSCKEVQILNCLLLQLDQFGLKPRKHLYNCLGEWAKATFLIKFWITIIKGKIG